MKLAITGTTAEKVGRMAAFADAYNFEAWPFDRTADFLAFLDTDPEAAGVLVTDDHLDACQMIVEWRAANLIAPMLVLLSDRRHGPADLARIIRAGADDAQHLSAEPEEIAARFYSLTRRRWTAAPIATPSAVSAALLTIMGVNTAASPSSVTFPQQKRA